MQIKDKKPKIALLVLLFTVKSYICDKSNLSMVKQLSLVISLVISILCASCITNKDIVYLQENTGKAADSMQLYALPKPYRVQTNDQLSINVKAIDPELVSIFNPTNISSSGTSEQTLYFNGYTVDAHGDIEFPILGKLHVLGYTTDEIEVLVKEELLKQYFKETAQLYVTVKLPGLNYTTLGEIGTGTHVIYKDRVNIIEAIAQAGDISKAGNRKDVLIIRQYPDGQRIHHIDLTTIDAMASEFYYIQNNDLILVKPLVRKTLGVGQTPLQTLSTIVSLGSVLTGLYFLIKGL